MVFKRRDRPSIPDQLRAAFLPRGGWRRAIEYIGHRIRRLPDTPHRIALGFACGTMVSFTPLFGLHFVLAVALAWALRGNLVAALIGTSVGNPLTLPFIAWISMALGRRILGTGLTGRDFERVREAFMGAAEGLWETLLGLFGRGESQWGKVALVWSEVMLPYLVGGLLPGIVTSIAAYYLVRPLVAGYQAARRRRLARRAPPPPVDPAANSGADAGR
jgi:uncharacterized protein (DUF2062 family)